MPKYVNRGKEMWARIRADKAAKAELAKKLSEYGLCPDVARYTIQASYESGVRQWELYFDGKFVSVHPSVIDANQEIIRLLGK